LVLEWELKLGLKKERNWEHKLEHDWGAWWEQELGSRWVEQKALKFLRKVVQEAHVNQ
jgi:hypothetical protein